MRSYSRLSVYRECPRLYHAKYVLRLPEEPSVWTVGGTAFHTCAEWMLSGLPVSWASAWDLAMQEVLASNPLADKPVAKWRAANRGKEDARWWSETGPDMVDRFAGWWGNSQLSVLDHDGPMLERRIEVQLGGVDVVAIPDAVVVDEHGQVDILDYKSGKPPKESLQLGVYAAALREAFDLRPTFGLYYMTRAGQALPIDLSKWPHTKVTDLFVEFDEREKAGDYSPTPGDHCRFCPVKADCPATKERT